jgi:hypothetical protein
MFAVNTETVDYVKIANRTAKLVEHYLKLPVTLITDHDTDASGFAYDNVIRIDKQGDTYRTEDASVRWRNFGRHLAYGLSPYDETTLLDSDYAVLDDSLLKLWETDFDYKLMHHNMDENGPSYEQMGETSLPFIWATIILFRKTHKSRLLFELVGKIQENYNYYRLLYNIREGNYRNDYAFAIANNLVNGYNLNEQESIPWKMFTFTRPVQSLDVNGNFMYVKLEDTDTIALAVAKQSVHIMDKKYLQSDAFGKFVEVMCE